MNYKSEAVSILKDCDTLYVKTVSATVVLCICVF